MQPRSPLLRLLFRVCVRLGLGLALLVGLCGMLAGVSLHAHAAPAATLTVTDCSGETGPGRIGTVIGSASAGDTITFSCSGTIPITSTLTIAVNLTLDGNGQSVTLDGGHSVRVLWVNSGVTFTLKALTIAHGFPHPVANGGGLLADTGSTVSISNSTFANNSANFDGIGGGLYNHGGTVTISNSTFANNVAPTGFGGGLQNDGTMSISNSTFANNSAPVGGGLSNNVKTVSISNSTFVNNSASSGIGGALRNGGTVSISNSTFANNSAPAGKGGGLDNFSGGTVTIGGSIVANNTGGNCAGGGVSSQGYNLESGTDCGFKGTGDLQNTDPKLASALASNGGPTQTLALLDGSPAINHIPTSACTLSTDQRGVSRPQGPACDIGAFEFRVPTLSLPSSPLTVDATSPQGATVTYTVTASLPDDASSTPTVSCSPASGSTFAIGTTMVTCSASDAATPADVTTGSFQVVVNDSDLGLTNMPGTITTNATSPQGAVVTYTPPTVVDEDNPLPTVTCTPASGSTFAIGTTTVTCTVSDSDDSNSPVSQSFQVVVKDVTPPVLSLPSTITVDATSPQGASVTYTVTATDPDNAASDLTISCSPASGSTFAIGTTTVNCSVSDPAGNTATGSFQVVVKGAAAQVTDLISLVNSFHLASSLQNTLDNKLQDVLTAINAGQTTTACSDLTDFIGFVQSHTGKGITQSQASQLIAAAQQIQAVLGC